MKKKIYSVLLLIVLAACFTCSAYAVEYSTEYPAYLEQSSGSYIEVESNLGRCAMIFPLQYKENTFGFHGSGNNVMNLTSSTLSGIVRLQNGTEYNIRAMRFNTFEYQQTTGYSSTYIPFSVSEIYNTNVMFYDEVGERGTTKRIEFEPLMLCLILSVLVFAVFIYPVFGRRFN